MEVRILFAAPAKPRQEAGRRPSNPLTLLLACCQSWRYPPSASEDGPVPALALGIVESAIGAGHESGGRLVLVPDGDPG